MGFFDLLRRLNPIIVMHDSKQRPTKIADKNQLCSFIQERISTWIFLVIYPCAVNMIKINRRFSLECRSFTNTM